MLITITREGTGRGLYGGTFRFRYYRQYDIQQSRRCPMREGTWFQRDKTEEFILIYTQPQKCTANLVSKQSISMKENNRLQEDSRPVIYM